MEKIGIIQRSLLAGWGYLCYTVFMDNDVITNNNLSEFVGHGVADQELEAMLKAGVHLGHSKSKNHPSMQEYIFGIRNNISIIDLVKTKEKLGLALQFIQKIIHQGGMILFVGTRPAAQKIIKEVSEKTQMPYFTERWIGGTLTNFKVISKRIEYMEILEKEKASGGFDKYTKKERMKKEEELVKLKKIFDGVRRLRRLPEILFVVNTVEDTTALREAQRSKIPIVALVDTNANIDIIQWPIPANDDALGAVSYMTTRIGDAIWQAQKEKNSQPKEDKVELPTS